MILWTSRSRSIVGYSTNIAVFGYALVQSRKDYFTIQSAGASKHHCGGYLYFADWQSLKHGECKQESILADEFCHILA